MVQFPGKLRKTAPSAQQARKTCNHLFKAPDIRVLWAANEKKYAVTRESNKDQQVFEQLKQFYGIDGMEAEEFHAFLLEFKCLRGEYGIKRDERLERKLYPDIVKL